MYSATGGGRGRDRNSGLQLQSCRATALQGFDANDLLNMPTVAAETG